MSRKHAPRNQPQYQHPNLLEAIQVQKNFLCETFTELNGICLECVRTLVWRTEVDAYERLGEVRGEVVNLLDLSP